MKDTPLDQILKEATKDLLSDESLKAISEAFKAQVDTTVEARLAESVASMVETQVKEKLEASITEALERQDNDYAIKLEQILEAIDTDHCAKLDKITQRLDEKHSAMLLKLVEKYDTDAKREAEKFKTTLVEKVSKFLDLRLAEAIPTEQLAEAVKNTRNKKILAAIREAVSLDEQFVTGEIRAALQDGKQQIEESKKTQAELAKKLQLVTEQANQLKTTLILEQKTSGLPKDKKDYIIKILKNKDVKFITENFDYVVDMFEKNEAAEVETLKETAETLTGKEKLDQPIITEDKEENDSPVAHYLEGLK